MSHTCHQTPHLSPKVNSTTTHSDPPQKGDSRKTGRSSWVSHHWSPENMLTTPTRRLRTWDWAVAPALPPSAVHPLVTRGEHQVTSSPLGLLPWGPSPAADRHVMQDELGSMSQAPPWGHRATLSERSCGALDTTVIIHRGKQSQHGLCQDILGPRQLSLRGSVVPAKAAVRGPGPWVPPGAESTCCYSRISAAATWPHHSILDWMLLASRFSLPPSSPASTGPGCEDTLGRKWTRTQAEGQQDQRAVDEPGRDGAGCQEPEAVSV